ncbi:MAG TPA: arsenic-transporting ATPase [Deltaproteobacteria bacterium]|nr:arsenic-transporting ATPase [Deltaproteobacteria bacterium]
MRLVLYTGKGGVGKTTTACATALCAAARSRRTLLASADAAHSLGDVLERRLGPRPTPIAACLDALELDARTEMAEHWGRIHDYLVSLLRYQGLEEVVAEELALLPGAEELSTLLGVEEHCRSGRYDLIVLDCAPTDSTLRLLTLPEVARGALRVVLHVQQALSAVVTPLARSLVPIPLPDAAVFRDIDQLLFRKLRALRRRVTAASSTVRLVVTPERMVIDEARRAFTDLALFEIPCDAVIMNRLLPPAAAREAFFHGWGRLQEERRREVEALFAPLPVLPSPLRDDEVTGLEALRAHGEELFGERAPDAILGVAGRVRFARDATGYRIDLPLPHAERAALDVAKIEDELVVRSAGRRRALKLPRRLAALSLASARFERDVLVVRFGAEGTRP